MQSIGTFPFFVLWTKKVGEGGFVSPARRRRVKNTGICGEISRFFAPLGQKWPLRRTRESSRGCRIADAAPPGEWTYAVFAPRKGARGESYHQKKDLQSKSFFVQVGACGFVSTVRRFRYLFSIYPASTRATSSPRTAKADGVRWHVSRKFSLPQPRMKLLRSLTGMPFSAATLRPISL